MVRLENGFQCSITWTQGRRIHFEQETLQSQCMCNMVRGYTSAGAIGKKWLELSAFGAGGHRLVTARNGGGGVLTSVCLFAGDGGNVADRTADILVLRCVWFPTRPRTIFASRLQWSRGWHCQKTCVTAEIVPLYTCACLKIRHQPDRVNSLLDTTVSEICGAITADLIVVCMDVLMAMGLWCAIGVGTVVEFVVN